MALKFSMILEAIDRASAPAKKARAALAGLTAGVRKIGQDARKMARDVETGRRSLESVTRQARRARQVLAGRLFQAASIGARQLASNLRAGIRNLDLLGRAGRGAKAGLGWLGDKALGLAKWGAAAAGAAGGFALFDMFRTAGQFEQYQVMLEGTEGSAAKARKAMAWVQKFAKDTPYELDQVMEAFVALKAYGIDPMNGSLQSLGDGASGMSKPIMASVEALADAITGEYERLKEFGIRASKAGDRVTFTYRKNGKDIQRTVKATGSEIERTITGIFSDRFGGGMARQAKTMFGIISNLKDSWSGFLLRIAEAGIFDKVKAGLQQLLDNVASLAESGELEKWAKSISDGLSDAYDWAMKLVHDTNWKEVGADLRAIAGAVAEAAHWMGALARLSQTINPLKGGLLGSVMRREQEKAAARTGPAQTRRQDAPNRRTRAPARAPQAPAAGRGNWRRLPSASKPQAAAPAQVGGRLAVDINVKGPATARVTRLETANRAVPIDARLGKAMGAPA